MSFDVLQTGLVESLHLAQSEPDGFVRGLIQLLVLLAFFGLPTLGRRSDKDKKKQTPRPGPPPTRASKPTGDPSADPGRDLWKELMGGLEKASEKVEKRMEQTNRALEAGIGARPDRARSTPPEAPGAPRDPSPLPPKARVRPETQLAPHLESGLSKTMSEDALERGLSLEDRMEAGRTAEEALERGGIPAREEFRALPSGIAEAGALSGTETRVQSSVAATSEISLFGRRIDAADLKRSFVLAEVLGRPIALRDPKSQPGSGPR